MVEGTLYQATATRSGDWWAISVPALRGVHSQAKRYRACEDAIREAIALHQDVDPSSFSVVVTPDLPDVLAKKIRMRRELVHDVERLQHELAFASADVLRDMVHMGFTQRDAADVLGISFQRVSQLVATVERAIEMGSPVATGRVAARARRAPQR